MLEIHITAFDDGTYRSVLFGNAIACPQASLCREGEVFDSLRRAFGLTQEKWNEIKKQIGADQERTAVIPITATFRQLEFYGFVGLEKATHSD